MMLEAPVLELCLFGLSVLRNRPCLRICLRLRLRQRRRELRLARLRHEGCMVYRQFPDPEHDPSPIPRF